MTNIGIENFDVLNRGIVMGVCSVGSNSHPEESGLVEADRHHFLVSKIVLTLMNDWQELESSIAHLKGENAQQRCAHGTMKVGSTI